MLAVLCADVLRSLEAARQGSLYKVHPAYALDNEGTKETSQWMNKPTSGMELIETHTNNGGGTHVL
jgi:hypothetical protein